MTIKINEIENSLEINDRLKQQYFLVKMALIFTIFNAILFPVFVLNENQLKWMGVFWIIPGVISMGILIYQVMKKTSAEKVRLSEISSLTEKQVFGRKRFSLKLKNGKLRDLTELKQKQDIMALKESLQKVGIKMT